MKKWNSILIFFFLSLSLFAEDFPDDFILNCKGQKPAQHTCSPFPEIEEDWREMTLSFSKNGGTYKDFNFLNNCYSLMNMDFGKIMDVVKNGENLSFRLYAEGWMNPYPPYEKYQFEVPGYSIRATLNTETRSLSLEKIDPDYFFDNVLKLNCGE
jgi:hypothetical protein